MTTTTQTFGTLKIGTIVYYNDMANLNSEHIILDSYTDQFGEWVNIMDSTSLHIEPAKANTEIGRRWSFEKR